MTINESVANHRQLRRLELALNRTFEAIHTHLASLETHKTNIEHYRNEENWNNLFKENVRASQTVKQLKSDLQEIENIRKQCMVNDIEKLDERISPLKDKVIVAVELFVDCHANVNFPSVSFDDYEHETHLNESSSKDNELHANLQIRAENDAKKRSFISWNALKNELFDLNSMTQTFAGLLKGHSEYINRIEGNIDQSHDDVVKGTRDLKKAAALKATVIPVTAALIGGAVGGPIGLLAGFKLAGVACALGGGIVGYAGGKFIQKKTHPFQDDMEMITYDENTKNDVKKDK